MNDSFIAAGLAAFMLVAASEELIAQEWEEIPNREARIVFYADKFGLTKRSTTTSTYDSANQRYEIGYWLGRDEVFLMYLRELAGTSRYWRREIEVDKDELKSWGYLQDRGISMGQEHDTTNLLGPVSYTLFQADDEACFGFAQSFGRIRGQRKFTKELTGFYCGDRGALSSEMIEEMLRSFGVAGFKVP